MSNFVHRMQIQFEEMSWTISILCVESLMRFPLINKCFEVHFNHVRQLFNDRLLVCFLILILIHNAQFSMVDTDYPKTVYAALHCESSGSAFDAVMQWIA